jgi:hypothetical protein
LKPSRFQSSRTAGLLVSCGLAVCLAVSVACGGDNDGNGGNGGDGPITEAEATDAANEYFATALGLFTGSTEAQAFIDLFAPECREDVDAAALGFVLLFMQAFAPDLQGKEIEEVDVGALTLEHTDAGTLVSPADPDALRVKVEGQFVAANDFFAESGFEPTEDSEIAEPVLLVRRDGKIYLGDCSELEGLSSGMGETADPTPASGPGSSRSEPIALGESAVVDDTWRLSVVNVNPDAWTVIEAANDFNEPPAAGERILLISVAAENIAKEDVAENLSSFGFALVGSRNELYSSYDDTTYCGFVPDELGADLFPGGKTEGNLCFKVSADETDFVLVWDSFAGGQAYFALE